MDVYACIHVFSVNTLKERHILQYYSDLRMSTPVLKIELHIY